MWTRISILWMSYKIQPNKVTVAQAHIRFPDEGRIWLRVVGFVGS